jgi:gas vesicle protein
MDKTKNILGGFLVGATVGTLAGILLAPASGEKTRNKLLRGSKKLKKQLSKSAEEVAQKAKTGYNKKVEEFASNGKHSIDSVKEKITL